MTYPYTATIEGNLRKINGMDADDYFLDNDEKLWIKPFETETFRAVKLAKISSLTFTDDDCLLDGDIIHVRRYDATVNRRESSGEARTELETLDWLYERLEGLPIQDRWTIKGVAWFEELRKKEDAETAETCAMINDDLDALAGMGSHVKRRPLPEAKVFKPVLLTDYQVSPQHRGDGQQAKSYEATIEGHKRQVTDFDEQGNLVVADGQRYIFERLNFNPPGQPPDEPAGDILGWPLLEAVRLQQWQGDWKWNDEPITLTKWIESELQNLCGKRGIPPEQRTEQIEISALLRVKPGELHLHYMTCEKYSFKAAFSDFLTRRF